jgi:hypothetical protein
MKHALDITTGSPSLGMPMLVSMRRGDMRRAKLRHTQHRCNSRRRGIVSEPQREPRRKVQASGCWRQRGRRTGQYCMSCPGDRGGYTIGNVATVLVEANMDEGRRHPCAPKTRTKIAKAITGNQNGAGHQPSKAARARMRAGCKRRRENGWLESVKAVTSLPSYRRKMSRARRAKGRAA